MRSARNGLMMYLDICRSIILKCSRNGHYFKQLKDDEFYDSHFLLFISFSKDQIIEIIERFFEIFSKQHYNYNEFVYWITGKICYLYLNLNSENVLKLRWQLIDTRVKKLNVGTRLILMLMAPQLMTCSPVRYGPLPRRHGKIRHSPAAPGGGFSYSLFIGL